MERLIAARRVRRVRIDDMWPSDEIIRIARGWLHQMGAFRRRAMQLEYRGAGTTTTHLVDRVLDQFRTAGLRAG